MNRILLYVHFNKYNKISAHVYYQLEQMRSLFSKIVFISNSKVSHEDL
ncbi:TPA: rhamnan synthesis protein F, partial [Streptococcus pyogenes]